MFVMKMAGHYARIKTSDMCVRVFFCLFIIYS